ncbi:MAG: hypothetical protein Q9205_005112, partial [Flavoplaca limonia]
FRPFDTRALLRYDGILDPAYQLKIFDRRVGCNVLKCRANGWEADADDGDARFNNYQPRGGGDGVCGIEKHQRIVDDVVSWERKLQTREILGVEAADRSHAKGARYTDPISRHAISEKWPCSKVRTILLIMPCLSDIVREEMQNCWHDDAVENALKGQTNAAPDGFVPYAQSVRRDQESDDNAGNADLEHGEDAYVKEEDRYLGGDEVDKVFSDASIHNPWDPGDQITDQAKGNPESPVVGANGKSDSPSRGDT